MIITRFSVPIYSSLVTTDLMPRVDDGVGDITLKCMFKGFVNERPCVRYLGRIYWGRTKMYNFFCLLFYLSFSSYSIASNGVIKDK
jgi:hypothetical protein